MGDQQEEKESIRKRIGLRLLRASEKLPLPLTRKVGGLLGLVYYTVNAKRRRIAKTNIAL